MSTDWSPDFRRRLTDFYASRLAEHGPTARGVDWISAASQATRFAQFLPLFEGPELGVLIDYGSSYGALVDFLRARGYAFEYWGFDLCEEALEVGRQRFAGDAAIHFVSDAAALPRADYCVASGTFNAQFGIPSEQWRAFVLDCIAEMWRLARRGIAFNALSSYAEADWLRAHLYFADPCQLFDHCKRNLSRRVALLHDYELSDFTIIVRAVSTAASGTPAAGAAREG